MPSPEDIESIVRALEVYEVERPLGTGGMGTVYLLKNRLTCRHFAGKVCILPDPADQRLFLEELRLWINLPVHPHLAACYFFRTVNDRVLIFAEYLSGGSVADRMRDGGLETIEQILDVAIQSARGLRALHEFGYVHGDVKPGNVLLSGDGQVKVADFGLAFSRQRIPRLRRGTNLYRSPEQLSETLTDAADVWSWGLTVLELFTRQPTWRDGNAAPTALREFLRRNGNMPPGLAAVLKQCFEWMPERRWRGMAEIEAELLAIHRQITGTTYSRAIPTDLPAGAPAERSFGVQQTNWPAPQTWLQWLWEQAGDGDEPASPRAPEAVTAPECRMAQAVSDLIAYEDVLSALQVMGARRPELKQKLPAIHLIRGSIFQHLHDYAAASSAFQQVIAACNEAPPASEDDRVQLLGTAWTNDSVSLGLLGRWDDALAALGKARKVYEDAGNNEGLAATLSTEALVRSARGEGEAAIEAGLRAFQAATQKSTGDWREVAVGAGALGALGTVALRWGQRERAAEILESAVENYEKLLAVSWTEADVETVAVEHPELARNEIQLALSIARPNRQAVLANWSQMAAQYCTVLADIGRVQEGAAIAVRGIERIEALEPSLKGSFAEWLAGFYLGLGVAELFARRTGPSVSASIKAVELYTELVDRQGRDDLGGNLGKAYANWASAVSLGGNVQAGIEILGRAWTLFEAYYRARPSQETAHNWARIAVNRGIVELQQHWQEAREFFDKALDLYGEVRGELASVLGDIAWAQASRAYARVMLGDVHGAIQDLNASVPVLKAEAKRTARVELIDLLNRIRMLWGDRDWGRVEDEVPAAGRQGGGDSGIWKPLKRWFGR